MNLENAGKISQAVPNFLKHYYFRSSHLRCSLKKGVSRNFAKFAGKHLCQGFFFNNVAGQARPATLLIKSLWYRCFPVNFAKVVRAPFYRTPPDDYFCYFHIKQHILLITYIMHTRMQMATQSLYKYIS